MRIVRLQIGGGENLPADVAAHHLADNRLDHRSLFQFLGFLGNLRF
jgi:hypothetical protein